MRTDSAAPGQQLSVLNRAIYYVLTIGVTTVSGTYVLMSSVEIRTPTSGGNFFNYPTGNAYNYDFSVEVLVDGAVVASTADITATMRPWSG